MSTFYLQLQSSKSGAVVNSFSPIPMNTTVTAKSPGDEITYDASTGMVTLHEPAEYLVEWTISVDSGTTPIKVGVMTSSDLGAIQDGSTFVPSEVAGSTVVTVVDSGVTLQLMNFGSAVTLASSGIVATMTVYAVKADAGSSEPEKLSIEFSSADGPGVHSIIDANGKLLDVGIVGSANASIVPIDYTISSGSGNIINLPYGTDSTQYMFIFPYDVTLVAASAVFNNKTSILLNLPTTILSPFVGIATQALEGTFTFDIQEESKVYPDPGYQMLQKPPVYILNTTVLTATNTDLNIPIKAGTPFVVVGGLVTLGLSTEYEDIWFHMNGTLVFEIDE